MSDIFRTRKQMFPGKGVIAAEFAAAATPEQAARAAAIVADGGEWMSNDHAARWGDWTLTTLDSSVKPTRCIDHIMFCRRTGNVTVAL